MALLEEEKAKIIEEELLRRKIREQEEDEVSKFLRTDGSLFDEIIRWGFIILVIFIIVNPFFEVYG